MGPNLPPPIPPSFLARMERLLGDEFGAFAASLALPPATGLRANTLKLSPQRLCELLPFDLAPLEWLPEGFLVPVDETPGAAPPADGPITQERSRAVDAAPSRSKPGKHPYHAAGLYYLQDPSAMVVARLLDPQPGERVLDLCAAPGGKATHIAALMGNRGLFVANETHDRRVWDLAENLERWGARHAAITNESPDRLAERFEGFFDRVLVDAPCSGEGMFRKSPAARLEWTPDLIEGCARRQASILEVAARLLRPGGQVVYATCTFAPEEDERTLARFLSAHADFELVEPTRLPGFGTGRPDWIAGGTGSEQVGRAVRLWPHTGPGEGHFAAVLHYLGEPAGSATTRRPPRDRNREKAARGAADLFHRFCHDHLARDIRPERLEVAGTYLYAVPPGLPNLTGLRFIHPGWWLGTVRRDRFEPAHALAMGLELADFARSVSLPAGDDRALAYLRGASFPSQGEDGWVGVGVDGFPLGWGKRVGGNVKSHYPKGLRWS